MPRDRIGVSTLFCINQDFKTLAKILPRLSVRYVEIMDDGQHSLNAKKIAALKKLKEDNGLEFTVHAPFADINIASLNSVLLNVMMKRLEKSIKHARQLDCVLWVFHPGSKTGLSFFYPEKEWHVNTESAKRLSTIAKTYGVKIAIENLPKSSMLLMKNVEEVAKFFIDFEGDVGFALDVGHANLNGQVEEFLTRFSKRIVHTHLSDNKGDRDSHLGIGHGTINWTKTAETLRRINYDGLLMLESIERVEESTQVLRKLFS